MQSISSDALNRREYFPALNENAQKSDVEKVIAYYQEEVAKLKAENVTLRHQNEILTEELKKSSKLPISNPSTPNNEQLRNEFVSKIKELYRELTGDNTEKEGQEEILTIWNWIKGLMKMIKDLLNENDKLKRLNNPVKFERGDMLGYITKLMKTYNLRDIPQLQEFIDNLLMKNTINKKRVEKLKKVLTKNQNIYASSLK